MANRPEHITSHHCGEALNPIDGTHTGAIAESAADRMRIVHPLIASKILAPTVGPHLVRGRLLNLIQTGLASCTATMLSGRAGSGKTVLAHDFAHSASRDVAWLSIDAPDVDFQRFWRHLTAAAGVSFLTPGHDSPSPSVAEARRSAELLIAEGFASTSSSLLVIEDLHMIYDAPWLEPFVGRLLPLLPVEVHAIVTGRGLPPTPLWRMRSKQTLNVIDETALAFTAAEAEELFSIFGLSRQASLVAYDATRGRVARLNRELWELALAMTKRTRGRASMSHRTTVLAS